MASRILRSRIVQGRTYHSERYNTQYFAPNDEQHVDSHDMAYVQWRAAAEPSRVPPNLKFEIDDATRPWSWDDNRFGFVHMRYLTGAISDWPALFW